MPIKKRSQARMLALQAVCLLDAVGDEFAGRLEEFLQDPLAYEDLGFEVLPPAEVLSFARSLALETWSQRQRYDALLAQHVPHWSVSRMPPVDRNILRIGLHELYEHDADRPPQVVISEAVNLAHRFGDANSPAFVNGVLDGIRRIVEQEGGGAFPDGDPADGDSQSELS